MKRTTQLNALDRFNAVKTAINAVESQPFAFAGVGESGVMELNASLLTQSSFQEALTAFAMGWRDDGGQLQRELDFFAPGVQTARRFEYAEAVNIEQFYSETTDDLRGIGADFKKVEYNSTKTTGKTDNRGLMVVVDLDEVKDTPGWEQQKVAMLMSRIKRNQLRRAIALLAAAATNTAKTWDTTAGKDPDMDVISDLVTAATAIGVKANRVGYGDTAWSKRALSHRAQSTAGGFASASLTEDALAGILGVDQVLRSTSRYASSATAKSEILSNLVLMFVAMQSADPMDSSNIKCFWTPTDQGNRYAVHSIPHGIKQHIIAVEHYELLKITSTLGIRKFTVS